MPLRKRRPERYITAFSENPVDTRILPNQESLKRWLISTMPHSQAVIEVFISHKSTDVQLAKELYHYLKEKGLVVFESDETLPSLGSTDYRKVIDKALDECRHMIVVGSSVEHIVSSWVEAEWGFYIAEKRAGRKKGNILTVITPDLKIEDLPASLRYYEVIYFKREHFERISAYVGKEYEDLKFAPPRKSLLRSRWLAPIVSMIVLLVITAYIFSERSKPFDLTVFLAQTPDIQVNPDYPAFERGELFVYIGNREEKQIVLPNQAAVFKQIPVAFKNKKIAVRLAANNWTLVADSIILAKTVNLQLIPDGSLGEVDGNIKDVHGRPVRDCRITIGADTTILSDTAGLFKAKLPYRMHRKHYVLDVLKDGYGSQKLDYFSGSGNIDVVMK